MKNYPINNLLREPTEAWSAITCLSLALLSSSQPHLFLLTQSMSTYAGIILAIPGLYRAWQAIRVKRYHNRLLAMPTYALSTSEIPLSKNWLFLGKGFRWRPSHTQKLHQIKQDIRNGDAVIVVDPKGDQELVRDMIAACEISGRVEDFKIVHLGFPDQSARYNPLKNYDQISEVATRITDAISAEGEGKQFAAFAWKYVNIVAICLEEMKQPITYKTIAFYISRLDQLLMTYADIILPNHYPNYHQNIEEIIEEHDSKIGKNNKTKSHMERHQAVIQYVKEHINKTIKNNNAEALHDQILIDLYDAAIMDKHYYDKITASVGPVLSEINKSNASKILSSKVAPEDIELMDVIKNKRVLYIGLDSLTNPNIAQAVGKAFLSDLVSTAGKIYKEPNARYTLNLHCDELSEIIQDSFVKILNKAGGAGFQVTAYAQTIQDMEVALGSRAKAEVSEGNFNTLIMLRIKNEETANLLIKVLPQVGVVGHTQVSMVNDTPYGDDGVYFNTTNEDRVQISSVPMIGVEDIVSLPKGQAFVLANGGEIYKVRIPIQNYKI